MERDLLKGQKRMKTRVLFVDDEAKVLAGLRRMLHCLRKEWEMEFVESGRAALARMEADPFDVVVTDMRMPGLDGAQLLTQIMERFPATLRIVLSGQADETSVLRAVTPAHQYLSKPCDADTLKATIARARKLRETLSDESLVNLVSQVTTLPSLPHIYTALLEELRSENASVHRVAELISQDVCMTAKLLQMVNSSFFGVPRHVESPSQAAALLGLNLLKPLVLSAGIFAAFDAGDLPGYSAESLMEHSMAVSHVAEGIARSCGGDKNMIDDTLLAGLLHDVGQLLLAQNMPSQFRNALLLAREKGTTLYEAELEVNGATHAAVGAYLLGLWGLADPIVEAVAYHHSPSQSMSDSFSPLTAVHVANVYVNDLNRQTGVTSCVEVDLEYLERLKMVDRVDEWRELAEQYFESKVHPA